MSYPVRPKRLGSKPEIATAKIGRCARETAPEESGVEKERAVSKANFT